jgi:hypothetical protein
VYAPVTTVTPQQYVSLTYVPYTGSDISDEALNMALFAGITTAAWGGAGFLLYRRREELSSFLGLNK